MHLPNFCSAIVSLLAIAHGVNAGWPYGPFSCSGRWIINMQGEHVTYAGVNWPGSEEAMIPEGLQYQSIARIVAQIKSLGMNVIRLTYAIEMIDDIFDNGGDVTIKSSMAKALGAIHGRDVFNQIVQKNPQFDSTTTRMEVFDAIAAECFRQQIYVHLDNHVSKAGWCCTASDGNGWFGDLYFDISKWQRGLKYMAIHGANWGNMMSMGMRNELRNAVSSSPTYGWSTWYTNMVTAASTIYSVNPNTLIFFSGLSYDTDLSVIPNAITLRDGKAFHNADFEFQSKTVLELHDYEYAHKRYSCARLKSTLRSEGFAALLNSVVNQLPVVMTEWGHAQDTVSYTNKYATCIRAFLPQLHAGWMVWVLAGSYYVRSGVQDQDENWGLLNHDWSDWRFAAAIDHWIRPMVNSTLA